MKSFAALACALCLFATTALAQTGPPQLPTGPLTASQAYPILVNVLGFSPVQAAEIVLKSGTAYGVYFTIDQALALVNGNEEND